MALTATSPQTRSRQVGIKSLVLGPILCLNKNGLAKMCLPVPLDAKGLRLAPRPSPALVANRRWGGSPFSSLLVPYGKAGFLPILLLSHLSQQHVDRLCHSVTTWVMVFSHSH